MTRYIAAYDTEELGACLHACERIRQVHERATFPATSFITGQLLEQEGSDYQTLLGRCHLFEIASHTYSHKTLRGHLFCGPAVPEEEQLVEVRAGKRLVEENLLKAHNLVDRPGRLVAWPATFPEAIPLGPIHSPEEEFAISSVPIDRVVDLGLPYVSLIWHPWSLLRFDPGLKSLELILSYVRDGGLEPTTYEAEWRRLATGL